MQEEAKELVLKIYHFKNTLTQKEINILLFTFTFFLIFILVNLIYYYLNKQYIKYKQFKILMEQRGFEKKEIKKIYKYLKKLDKPPHIIFSNEKIAKEAAKELKLNENEFLKKLGFDKNYLIKSFLAKQQELRKKWNKK